MGCSGWALPNGSRCRGRHRQRRRDTYDSPSYRALGRPSGPCRLRLQGCTGIGDTWHHVIPLAKGGNHARANAVSACGHCNSSKRDRL
ncbi:HNH endonuclease [Mycolicibacterium palauense]|uniref:HNH endonuclease n=1 Tax=Mycolicibacterium palauense TaxID=2034511 RepID=UPI0038992E52